MTAITRASRQVSLGLASVMAAGALLVGAQPAAAAKSSNKENMYKIGTYVLGAGTIYALTQKKGTLALLGAAGTYFAYRGWKKEKDKRRGVVRRSTRRR